MKRRILSILMYLCMTLCLLPTAALAEDSITQYAIWVGGVQVTSENAGGVTGDDITGTVNYDVTSNTLTLSDASITGAYTDGNSGVSAAIYAGADLTIQLIGGNTVIGPNTESSYSFGVYGTNALTITGSGSGSLNATGGTATHGGSLGVYGTSISVTGGAVTATGGAADNSSCGIYSDSVTVQAAGALTAKGGAADNSSIGVYCSNSVEAAGTLTATGGEVRSKGASSYGIYCNGSVTVQATGALTATGGKASLIDASSYGIYSGSVTVQAAGTLTATGGEATETNGISCGIYGNSVEAAGTLTATGGEATETNGISCGIYGNSVEAAGTLTATGGAAGGSSCGVLSDKVIPVTGGTTTAISGTVTSGTSRAMSPAPDLTGYTASHGVIVSNNADGSNPASYDADSIATYKYLKIVPLYALTVNLNGGSGTTATGNSYMANTVIPIDAGAKPGYTFSGWTATGGGSFASASSAATTYTMPAGAATITAIWTANSTGGGGDTSTTTVPVSSGSGTVNFSASVSWSTATVSATDAQLQKITSGTETGAVKIDASDLKMDAVVIPAKIVSALNNAAGTTSLEILLPTGTVTLDETALATVAGKGDVKLSVETVSNTKLTDKQKAVLGTQVETTLVVDVNVYVGGNRTSTFGDGKIQVSVPYTLKSGENADSITVWFIKDDGTIEPKTASYANGNVTFITDHLSLFLIVDFPFADVAENSWYYGSVAYAYNHGLFAGTSDTIFSPGTGMTRQMIWMVLARMDGKAPADMDAARTWAMENDISDGSNPTNSITREQMAAILYRYAQYKGYDTSIGEETNILSYDDALTISEYAIPAIQWTCGAGLMQGSNNNIMPSGSATRAQVATILQRFCQNVAK